MSDLFSFIQGTVESIALKEPKERTKIFECISQSNDFATEYNKKREALLKAKEDIQFHFNKKKSATAERKQMFKDKVEVTQGQSILKYEHIHSFDSTSVGSHVGHDSQIPFERNELRASF